MRRTRKWQDAASVRALERSFVLFVGVRKLQVLSIAVELAAENAHIVGELAIRLVLSAVVAARKTKDKR